MERMYSVRIGNRVIQCSPGENLRSVMLRAGVQVHNGPARVVNCMGHGLCGTCAVRVRGSLSWPSDWEQTRLKMIPHASTLGLRLACQCKVHGNISVEKYAGLCGNSPEPPAAPRPSAISRSSVDVTSSAPSLPCTTEAKRPTMPRGMPKEMI